MKTLCNQYKAFIFHLFNLLGITVYVKLYESIPIEQGDAVTDR